MSFEETQHEDQLDPGDTGPTEKQNGETTLPNQDTLRGPRTKKLAGNEARTDVGYFPSNEGTPTYFHVNNGILIALKGDKEVNPNQYPEAVIAAVREKLGLS